jgi:hypothetical protein
VSISCLRYFLPALEQALAEMHPDEMSPKVALEALYRLKGLLAKGRT